MNGADNYVLTRQDLIDLLNKGLWSKAEEFTQDIAEIYEGVYDIMTNGTENGISYEGLNIEGVADDILYCFGSEKQNEYDMTMEQLERELGRKIRIIS